MVNFIAFYIYLLLPMSSMLSYVSIAGLLKLKKNILSKKLLKMQFVFVLQRNEIKTFHMYRL